MAWPSDKLLSNTSRPRVLSVAPSSTKLPVALFLPSLLITVPLENCSRKYGRDLSTAYASKTLLSHGLCSYVHILAPYVAHALVCISLPIGDSTVPPKPRVCGPVWRASALSHIHMFHLDTLGKLMHGCTAALVALLRTTPCGRTRCVYSRDLWLTGDYKVAFPSYLLYIYVQTTYTSPLISVRPSSHPHCYLTLADDIAKPCTVPVGCGFQRQSFYAQRSFFSGFSQSLM